MNSDQKMAALGGILSAVAVFMAFYGGDWLTLFQLLKHGGNSAPSMSFQNLFPAECSVQIDRMPQACPASPFPSERIFPPEHAEILRGGILPRKPDRPPRPVIPALAGNDALPAKAESSPSGASLTPKHAVPVAAPSFASASGPSAVRFAPYFYRYGELQGRISQNEEKNASAPDAEGNYFLNQSIRHFGKDLTITLSLGLPPEKNLGKSAVIFSQKIPDGWDFVKNQGCSGWHMEQQRTLKFLAMPDRPDTPLQISLFFTSRNIGGKLPPIEKATCAVQDSGGFRKLCHVR